MTLDKAIKYGKELRQPYRRSQAFDPSCRHGGNCKWCERNRRSAERKLQAMLDGAKKESE